MPRQLLISTHAPLAGRDSEALLLFLHGGISTHAPLAGRDRNALAGLRNRTLFQPTRPLRGATISCNSSRDTAIFQPTRPLRGATIAGTRLVRVIPDFNPRAPCGARRSLAILQGIPPYFNPRAPCGARQRCPPCSGVQWLFQPTRPLRGATRFFLRPLPISEISTHAPLAGRDQGHGQVSPIWIYFNPRAPCGARPSRLKLSNER